MANLFGRDDVALGVALPFGSGLSNFKLNYTTLDQARTNIVNLLLTHKGERFMQPDFGTQIIDSLFEPSTEDLEVSVEEGLNEDIALWLPYILIDEINVTRLIDQHILDIALRFKVTENGANQVIKLLVDEDGVQITSSY